VTSYADEPKHGSSARIDSLLLLNRLGLNLNRFLITHRHELAPIDLHELLSTVLDTVVVPIFLGLGALHQEHQQDVGEFTLVPADFSFVKHRLKPALGRSLSCNAEQEIVGFALGLLESFRIIWRKQVSTGYEAAMGKNP
jgi:hypothetical protein